MKEEVQEVVKELKGVKAVRFSGCGVECLKSGDTSVIKWLGRLLK